MLPDRSTANKLLSLSDEELTEAINTICKNAGIDTSKLGINRNTIGMLRSVLSSASEADIARIVTYFGGKK